MTSSATRVLVLTSLFPSRPGEKQGNFVLDHVRELAAQGADVTVLIAKPWIPSLLRPYANREKLRVDPAEYSLERLRVMNASFFSLPRFALGRLAAHFLRNLVPAIEF